MLCKHLSACLLALIVAGGSAPDVGAQAQPAASAASAPQPFSQIPLRRDGAAPGSAVESVGWAALLLALIAGAGLMVVRRKTGRGAAGGWLRTAAGPSVPKTLGRLSITSNTSLHVVEWHGEELLLGCTSQAITVVSRHPCTDLKDKP